MAALEAPHVVLFKPTDLRLHDHAALLAAHEAASVVHLLVLDPRLGFGPGAAPSREAGLARIEGKEKFSRAREPGRQPQLSVFKS